MEQFPFTNLPDEESFLILFSEAAALEVAKETAANYQERLDALNETVLKHFLERFILVAKINHDDNPITHTSLTSRPPIAANRGFRPMQVGYSVETGSRGRSFAKGLLSGVDLLAGSFSIEEDGSNGYHGDPRGYYSVRPLGPAHRPLVRVRFDD